MHTAVGMKNQACIFRLFPQSLEGSPAYRHDVDHCVAGTQVFKNIQAADHFLTGSGCNVTKVHFALSCFRICLFCKLQSEFSSLFKAVKFLVCKVLIILNEVATSCKGIGSDDSMLVRI